MHADWDTISYVKGSAHRSRVLELIESPKTPTEIQKELKLSLSHTSQILNQLTMKGLAECLTHEQKKTKLYRRTELGIDALQQAKKL